VTGDAARLSDAGRVRDRLSANLDRLDSLAEQEGYGIERLFAGLFASTYRQLVAHLDRLDDAEFASLTVLRFFDLYDDYVARPARGERAGTAPHWRRYAALVEWMEVTSPIGAHFWLIMVGARAHTRHDLREAVCLAADDYRRRHGRDPDFAAARSALVGPPTDQAFFAAALDYIAMHRRQQRGWRRLVLGFYALTLHSIRPVWLGIFQSWRRAAWREAMARLPALAAPHEEEWPLRQPPPGYGWSPSP
jgi:hypothetical protein